MVKIDHEKCAGCGGCVDVCVDEVLVMEGERVMVINPDDCNECGECEMACPCEAITVEED